MTKNLAIKGGGVKGIAYVGAIAELDKAGLFENLNILATDFNISLTDMDNLIESGRKSTVKYISQRFPATSKQPIQSN
jgi:hypothetical protein